MTYSTTLRQILFGQAVILSFAFSWILSSGCNGPKKPEGMPKIYPVQIIVNQDGKPLAEAAITLFNSNPELTRWVPGGTTDASGKVSPRTAGQFEGVPEGSWKVLVSRRVTEYSEELVDPNMPEMGKKITALYDSVDPKYNDRTATPLTVDVKRGSTNTFTLDAGNVVRIPVKRLDR